MKITDELLYKYAPKAREIWLETIPDQDENTDFTPSEAFQRQMDEVLAQAQRTSRFKKLLRGVGRAAAVFVIVLSIVFGSLMTVEAFREKVIHVVRSFFSGHMETRYSSDEEYAPLPEIEFLFVPEGMELVEDDTPFPRYRHILYEDELGRILEIDINRISQNTVATHKTDTEDAEIWVYSIQDREVMVISEDDQFILMWEDGNIVFDIYSNLPFSELEAVVDGITIIPKTN